MSDQVTGSKDSLGARGRLAVAGTEYEVFRLAAVPGAQALPFSLKVLLENLLRSQDRSEERRVGKECA